MQKRNRLSKQDLRALGVSPGLLSTRYLPGSNKAQIRRLVDGPRKDYFAKRVTRRIKVDEPNEPNEEGGR